METSELELAFYRNLLTQRPRSAASFTGMLAAPLPFHFTLPSGRMVFLERLGGRDAKWRAQIAAPDGARTEVDTRTVEHHLDSGWSWLRALEAHAIGSRILEHALDRLPCPLFLLDGTGSVLLQNVAARHVLEHAGVLRIEAGRLCTAVPRRPIDSQFLRIHGIGHGETGANVTVCLEAPSESTESTMYLDAYRLAPQPGEAMLGHCVAWLITVLAGPAKPRLSLAALRQLLGLTPAEALVVRALFEGERPADVALSRKVSRETVKKHLSSVFRKCRVTSQTQLLRVIALGPFFCAPEQEDTK
jgi:DNA-binding CsgD family transcriptional regulator